VHPNLTNVSDEALQGLLSLGFTREQCIRALQAANGNADVAASMLFGGF
jgi:Holliday junction resolvasome RuvABC DNA-binding subunit